MKLFKHIPSVILITILFLSCGPSKTKKEQAGSMDFVAWENPCFDRSASIWLIRNFVDSTATFRFIEFGKRVDEGIPFDVPGAELGRQGNLSCFETVLNKYEIRDPALLEMAKLVHDIDVNKWGVKLHPQSDSLNIIYETLKDEAKNEEELLNTSTGMFDVLYAQYKAQ